MPHKEQELYSNLQKELSAAYKEAKKVIKWSDFQKEFHCKRKAEGPSN